MSWDADEEEALRQWEQQARDDETETLQPPSISLDEAASEGSREEPAVQVSQEVDPSQSGDEARTDDADGSALEGFGVASPTREDLSPSRRGSLLTSPRPVVLLADYSDAELESPAPEEPRPGGLSPLLAPAERATARRPSIVKVDVSQAEWMRDPREVMEELRRERLGLPKYDVDRSRARAIRQLRELGLLTPARRTSIMGIGGASRRSSLPLPGRGHRRGLGEAAEVSEAEAAAEFHAWLADVVNARMRRLEAERPAPPRTPRTPCVSPKAGHGHGHGHEHGHGAGPGVAEEAVQRALWEELLEHAAEGTGRHAATLRAWLHAASTGEHLAIDRLPSFARPPPARPRLRSRPAPPRTGGGAGARERAARRRRKQSLAAPASAPGAGGRAWRSPRPGPRPLPCLPGPPPHPCPPRRSLPAPPRSARASPRPPPRRAPAPAPAAPPSAPPAAAPAAFLTGLEGVEEEAGPAGPGPLLELPPPLGWRQPSLQPPATPEPEAAERVGASGRPCGGRGRAGGPGAGERVAGALAALDAGPRPAPQRLALRRRQARPAPGPCHLRAHCLTAPRGRAGWRRSSGRPPSWPPRSGPAGPPPPPHRPPRPDQPEGLPGAASESGGPSRPASTGSLYGLGDLTAPASAPPPPTGPAPPGPAPPPAPAGAAAIRALAADAARARARPPPPPPALPGPRIPRRRPRAPALPRPSRGPGAAAVALARLASGRRPAFPRRRSTPPRPRSSSTPSPPPPPSTPRSSHAARSPRRARPLRAPRPITPADAAAQTRCGAACRRGGRRCSSRARCGTPSPRPPCRPSGASRGRPAPARPLAPPEPPRSPAPASAARAPLPPTRPAFPAPHAALSHPASIAAPPSVLRPGRPPPQPSRQQAAPFVRPAPAPPAVLVQPAPAAAGAEGAGRRGPTSAGARSTP
eukprot:tig00000142_g8650.t1